MPYRISGQTKIKIKNSNYFSSLFRLANFTHGFGKLTITTKISLLFPLFTKISHEATSFLVGYYRQVWFYKFVFV